MKMEIIDNEHERTYILKEELVPVNITRLEEELNSFLKLEDRDILIDLEFLNKIDSITMALFIRIKKKLEEKGRTLFLTNPNDTILRVLKLSGLDEFLLE